MSSLHVRVVTCLSWELERYDGALRALMMKPLLHRGKGFNRLVLAGVLVLRLVSIIITVQQHQCFITVQQQI